MRKAIAEFLVWLASKIYKPDSTKVKTRNDLLGEAKKIHKGAVILFTVREKYKFAFAWLIQDGVMDRRSAEKLSAKAERKLAQREKEKKNE